MSNVSQTEQAPDLRSLLIRAGLVVLAIAMLIALVWMQLSSGEGTLDDRVREMMAQTRSSVLAPVIAVLLLVVLNVAGVPLMVLTAGATVVFASGLQGFFLSWLASMIGATIGYGLGRLSGGALLRTFGGERLNALSEMLGRRGFLTCFGIRLIPTAPAIVVNMVIGASHVGPGKFLAGTALGIAPKLAFIAAITQGVAMLETRHSPLFIGALAALVVIWIVTMVALRRLMSRFLGVQDGARDFEVKGGDTDGSNPDPDRTQDLATPDGASRDLARSGEKEVE